MGRQYYQSWIHICWVCPFYTIKPCFQIGEQVRPSAAGDSSQYAGCTCNSFEAQDTSFQGGRRACGRRSWDC